MLSKEFKGRDNTLLGALLIDAGVVSRRSVDDALKIGRQSKLILGRVLTMERELDEPILDTANQLQCAVRRLEITRENAIQALRMVNEQNVSLSDALSALALSRQTRDNPGNCLGQILLSSGLINRDQFRNASRIRHRTGWSLGWSCMALELVNRAELEAALLILSVSKSEIFTQVEASALLALMRTGTIRLRHVKKLIVSRSPDKTGDIQLAELFFLCGAIRWSEMVAVVEESLSTGKQTGALITSRKLAPEVAVEWGLRFQSMVRQRKMSAGQSVLLMASKFCKLDLNVA